MLTVLIEVREEVYSKESAETLSSIGIVGLVRVLRGKYKQAETMHRQILA